jgi:aconitate hydratase
MGVLPLQFPAGQSANTLGLGGEERFWIGGIAEATAAGRDLPRELLVRAQAEGSEPVEFDARVRIDTPREAQYFRHGGILPFVLRGLLAG